MNPNFFGIVDQIETDLSEFYGDRLIQNANSFLVFSETNKSEVLVKQGLRDTVEIQIKIPASLAHTLIQYPPERGLDLVNLNPYLVLVEEVSHFYHLCFLINQNCLPIQRMDLEWMGEADKLILLAKLLKQKNGGVDIHQIHNLLFSQVRFDLDSEFFYKDIHNISARFWKKIIGSLNGTHELFYSPELRDLLRNMRFRSWEQKVKAA